MVPKLFSGGRFADQRGSLFYNNDFDASIVKRIYLIENAATDLKRGWQGHKIEQRWFSAMCGSFTVKLIAIDNWETPSKDVEVFAFSLCSEKLDVLHVPPGYVSCIQAKEKGSKLLVMADYSFGEIKDEYRLPFDYFEKK